MIQMDQKVIQMAAFCIEMPADLRGSHLPVCSSALGGEAEYWFAVAFFIANDISPARASASI